MLCQVFWPMGLLVMDFMAYFIRDWRYIQMAITLPGLLTIALYWYVGYFTYKLTNPSLFILVIPILPTIALYYNNGYVTYKPFLFVMVIPDQLAIQCQHLIPALNAWEYYTTGHPITIQCPGLTTERIFVSQAPWVIDVLALIF